MTQRSFTILGAGAVGVSIALYLQRDGHHVRLVDQGEPGSGCSYGNAGLIQCASVVPIATPGMLSTVPKMLLDPDQPLVLRWRHLLSLSPYLLRLLSEARPERVDANSRALASIVPGAYDAYRPLIDAAGLRSMVARTGELHVYENKRSFAGAHAAHNLRRARGVQVEVLTAEQVGELEPALTGRCRHGVFLPEAYQTVNPHSFIAALARNFIGNGGEFVKMKVDDVSKLGDGSFSLRSGTQESKVENLVIALGAFSKPWAAKLGSAVCLNSERGYHLTLPNPGVTLRRLVISGDYKFAMSPVDAGIRLAGTAEMARVGAAANYGRALRLLPLARRLLPGLANEGQTMWMGHRPSTPDSLPVICRSPHHQSLFYAFGHGHSGLTLGGITGKLISDLVARRSPGIDLSPFSIARFAR